MSTVIAKVGNDIGEALDQRFEEIFRQHAQFVYRTAYSVTGNRQDAEDVVQTLFLKLFERDLPSAVLKNPRAYLCRAAINLALNAVRTRKRQRLAEGADLLQKPATVPEESNFDEEIQRRLLEAIPQLKPKAVEMLILRYEHNLSDADIAQMLRKSRGSVAVALNRARARLRNLLGDALGKRP